jgi:putative acetyltransferase
LTIRHETNSDVEAIRHVTRAAFQDHPHSIHTEEFIIDALRTANALSVSLVAEVDGKIAGHIAFSPVAVSDGSGDWYGVGPLSVLPEYQRRGIGSSLVHEGLTALKAMGAKGCVLVGDPGYYKRFGFRNYPDLVLDGVPQEYFLALPFGESNTRGRFTFHQGFSATG